MRIGACQTPEFLGDIEAALSCLTYFAGRAPGVDVLLFPECFLQGYLADREHVRRYALDLESAAFAAVLRRLEPIAPMLVFGVIERCGDRFHNAAVVVAGGAVVGVYRKSCLLQGESLFEPGDAYPVFEANGVRFGINICYDTQFADPPARIAAQGARLLLVPAQNMMRRAVATEWQERHHAIRAERARETGLWLVSADVTGERGDDRIALGPTSVMNPRGEVVAQVPLTTTGLVVYDVYPL